MIASCSSVSAVAWTLASMLVTSVSPGCEGTSEVSPSSRPNESTATDLWPGMPRSHLSYSFSTPARPTTEVALSDWSLSDFAWSYSSAVIGLR